MAKTWEKEVDLCRDFTAWVRASGQWEVYAEVGGWDLLLVRLSDGFQIGIEAKLSLNVKVLCQVLESDDAYKGGPDVHAVLVPAVKTTNGLGLIARRLNIVVIEGDIRNKESFCTGSGRWIARGEPNFSPSLPDSRREWRDLWPERCPDQRLTLPDYVPDVVGGNPAPVMLTDWKVRAIKIMVIIEKLGSVRRADFKALKIDYTRWTQYWLRSDGAGGWVIPEKPRFQIPDFKAQHPVNYQQIYDQWEEWSKSLPPR